MENTKNSKKELYVSPQVHFIEMETEACIMTGSNSAQQLSDFTTGSEWGTFKTREESQRGW